MTDEKPKLTLAQWMDANGATQRHLMIATGCSRANASRLYRGLIVPGREIGDRIIAWTNGEVDWNSLMQRSAA